MHAVNFSAAKHNLKQYCDMAVNNSETIVVARKCGKNVVIMSEDDYNRLMAKLQPARNNYKYPMEPL